MPQKINNMLSLMSPDQRRRATGAAMAGQFDRPTPQDTEVVERGAIAPFGTYANGQTGLAWPGLIAEPVQGFNNLFNYGYNGGAGDTHGVEDAFNVAGAAMLGGIAAPRPRNALGTASRPEPSGIRAFHGSPHDFDKFSLEKIGTGEGAQAYGHGLYFAENEGVAKSYRGAGEPGALQREQANRKLRDIAREMDRDPLGSTNPELRAKYDAALAERDRVGRMYEVKIKADPNDFLDWDKPMSQQPQAIQSVLGNYSRQGFDESIETLMGNARQSIGYKNFLGMKKNPDAILTGKLAAKGIPGIRYLDQGSRTSGDGYRNYVVFDDALIEILRKYGLLGMIGGGGAAAASGSGPTNNLLSYYGGQPQPSWTDNVRPGDI